MRFLGPHSASEGPHLVPISLKIGSPLGPHFDKLGSPWHVATVRHIKYAVLVSKKVLERQVSQMALEQELMKG